MQSEAQDSGLGTKGTVRRDGVEKGGAEVSTGHHSE